MDLPVKVTFLKALDGELEQAPIMKFRLTYHDELRATGRDPNERQIVPLAEHKHRIRQCFHKQLKRLWETNRFLNSYCRNPGVSIDHRSISDSGMYFDHDQKDKIPLIDYVASRFVENNYKFVPLVCSEFGLLCSLDILFLRRDIPGSAIQAGDIDNRVRTLIDGLRKPKNANELRGNETPKDGETPFFCLLEDDNSVSHFAVETDTLLDEVKQGDADKRKALVVVTVELRPYLPTYFNLAFA